MDLEVRFVPWITSGLTFRVSHSDGIHPSLNRSLGLPFHVRAITNQMLRASILVISSHGVVAWLIAVAPMVVGTY